MTGVRIPSNGPAEVGTAEGVAAASECWFCSETSWSTPPGGWLIDDGIWRAGNAPAKLAIPGTVILATRRHLLDQATFGSEEADTVTATTGRLLTAIRTATGCDRIYQWATMDAYPHFHLWLLPWWETKELRGPRYLQSVVFNVTADPERTRTMADDIAAALREGSR